MKSDSESLLSPEQLCAVRRIVTWCKAKKLTSPALFMLESHRPAAGILSFALEFSAPFMPAISDRLSPILSSPAALDLLLSELRDADGN